MKKTATAAMAIACALTLTACSTSETGSSTDDPQTTTLEFAKETGLGMDVSDQLPGSGAIECDSRNVMTTDGLVTLKNFEIVNDEATFYFAPNASSYNSYTYVVQFANGKIGLEDPRSGEFTAWVKWSGDTTQEPVTTTLGSNYLTGSFQIPANKSERLGQFKWASAAINGEHAGECR